MTSKSIAIESLIPSRFRDGARRAFSCWPSRIGAASLVALALTCGVDAVGPIQGSSVTVAANAAGSR